MSVRPILLAFGLAFALTLAAGDVAGQACHDWDADGALSGWGCGTTSDCLDLSWFTRPGAADVCDGLDNDCDGTLDATCDRYCDQPTLFGIYRTLPIEDLPQAGRGCAGLTDRGFLAASDRVVGQTQQDALIYARAYDRLAVAWGPSSAVGEPATPSPSERRCEIATVGSRALIVYRDEQTRNSETYRLKARIVDDLGYPLGAGPIDLSATSPVYASSPWFYFSPVWDGDRFVVFWTPYVAGLLMSIIHPDGTLDQPATLLVTDNIDGHYSAIQEVKAVWTGDHFLVAVTTDTVAPDLHVLNVTRDGLLTNNVSISTRADHNIDVALGADRFVVAFSQGAAGQLRAYAAYFGLDGSYLDPPGTVFLYGFTSSYAGQSTDIRASWSGEMFGVTMASYDWLGGYPVNSWRFWRLLPSGTNLDPGGILLSRDTSLDTIYKLIWAGGDWWLFATRNPKKFVRERIVCSCGDADGDGFNQCTFDCDDSDPSTHPGATEVCRGLKDKDCDGLVDCDDPDCPGGPGPADVTDLKWSGRTSLVWSAVSGAQRYDLARGLISDVTRRKDLMLADCPGQKLIQNSWADDSRNPPPGDALWYLVRTEGTPCALGSWGEATVPRQVSACR